MTISSPIQAHLTYKLPFVLRDLVDTASIVAKLSDEELKTLVHWTALAAARETEEYMRSLSLATFGDAGVALDNMAEKHKIKRRLKEAKRRLKKLNKKENKRGYNDVRKTE